MKIHLTNMKNFLDKELDPAFTRRARIVLENLELKPGMKILDIGCGRGFYERAVVELFPSVEIIGVDVNKKYLPKWKHPRAIFQQAEASSLPFVKASFDRIICSEVLEHVKDDLKVLEEMERVLKIGGKVLVTVPVKNYPFLWDPVNFILERLFSKHIPSQIWWLAGIWADHQRLYTKPDLLTKFKKVGFKTDRTWESTHHCFPFSHFLLYSIGKNLIERGIVGKSFNRFDFQSQPTLVHKYIKKIFWIFDRLNYDSPAGNRYVNLVVRANK